MFILYHFQAILYKLKVLKPLGALLTLFLLVTINVPFFSVFKKKILKKTFLVEKNFFFPRLGIFIYLNGNFFRLSLSKIIIFISTNENENKKWSFQAYNHSSNLKLQ
jgi:hypothetical protein